MQFIENGPDIPDDLIQAHEEGRVVFFCGAGISYPAGLPGFKGLVQQIYVEVGAPLEGVEKKLFRKGQYDATLDHLERRLLGHRVKVRKALAQSLKPKLARKEATATHEALLCLARNKDNVLRLVTTNFDRVFHAAADRANQTFTPYVAPMLPIPKDSRWNGLVYLHSLLPELEDEAALQRLVVTSGDFGLAYLTERWAARFVTELFRNYQVCFVGYGINDPVMRYMMDALAADRMQGENTPQVWGFGPCRPGNEANVAADWEAKGVTPILYNVRKGRGAHSLLHATLRNWAAIYRDGVPGKERIVLEYVHARPSVSTRQDDFVGRMLWALSDPSGLPARLFANLNPAPPLEWLLHAFTDERYGHKDLPRFGVLPHGKVADQLRFSLMRRPVPPSLAPRMALIFADKADSKWDAIMFQLARWLVRHLNDPRLILWIVQQGGRLHDRWVWLIEDELNKFSELEREAKAAELEEIRKDSPNAIPIPPMRTLWLLLLTERIKSTVVEFDFFRWKDRFERDDLAASLRIQLRELLAPKLKLDCTDRWRKAEVATTDLTHVWQLVHYELAFSVDNIRSGLVELAGDKWNAALPLLLEDFQALLHNALDLLHEIGDADEHDDRSHFDISSITPHWQNSDYKDWTVLIELLRDSWLIVNKNSVERATRIALAWFELPYPTFKRLALFAASQGNTILPEQWTEWLLTDKTRWLWAEPTQREVCRLLALRGSTLGSTTQTILETAILAGPPSFLFKEDIEPDTLQKWTDFAIWLRLSKLQVAGLSLGAEAASRLHNLSKKYSEDQFSKHEREEFLVWRSGTDCPDYEENRTIDIAPHKKRELVGWIKTRPVKYHFNYEDNWRDVCKRHPANAFFALSDLAEEGLWPSRQWKEALGAWSNTGYIVRGARYSTSHVAPLLRRMPDDAFQEISDTVVWWLGAVSMSIRNNYSILFNLCRRALDLAHKVAPEFHLPEKPRVTLDDALNQLVGRTARVLLNLLFLHELNDNQGLQPEIKPFFTELCDPKIELYIYGRAMLASELVTLFRLDPEWTTKHLLPQFKWENNSTEATAVWTGFLLSARSYQPLVKALKDSLLETASHYNSLDRFAEQYATFLTYRALDMPDGYTRDDFRISFSQLPQEGLENAVRALEMAGEHQREAYWKAHIKPFWHNVWPKSHNYAQSTPACTPRTVELFVQLCAVSGPAFPEVLETIKDWLYPVKEVHHGIRKLEKSKLCQQYPAQALQLLASVIDTQGGWIRNLKRCLESLAETDPSLIGDQRYKRLAEYSRTYS